MSQYFPPTVNSNIFNDANFVQKPLTDEINELTPYFLRYPKAQGTQTLINTNIIGNLNVLSPTSVNIDAGSSLNLGTDSPTIAIGGPTSNTTIYGNTTYVSTTNLDVKDANILMNKTGISPYNAGIQVESSGSIVSSILNDSLGDWKINSTNNKIYIDELSENSAGHNIVFSSNVDMGSRTLSMTNGKIQNIPLIKGNPSENLAIEQSGSASITFKTGNNGTNTLVLDSSKVATFTNLPVCSSVPSSGSQLVNKTYVDSLVGGTPTLSSVLASGNSAGANSINMNGQDITNVDTLATTGIATFSNTTPSTLKTNGSVVLAGGLGVNEKINCNSIQTTTTSTFPNINMTGGLITNVFTLSNSNARLLLDSVADSVKFQTGAIDRFSIDNTGKTSILANIASTSSTTGSLVVTGGIGVSKSIFSGENIEAIGNIVARNRFLAYGTGDATSTWEMAPGYKAGTITPGYVTYNVAGTTSGVHYFNDKVEMSSLSIPNGATDSQGNAGLFVYSNTTDTTANGLPTGSAGCSNNIVYGFRNNFLSTDATDSTFSYYGFQGGSTPDPDFMISYKYGRGMLIYNSTTAEIDAWGAVGAQERLRVSGTAKVTGAFSTDGLSTFNAGIDMVQQNITNAYKVQNGNTSLVMDTSNNLLLGTSATTRLTIDSAGLVISKGETKIEGALRPATVITQDKFTTGINTGTFQSTFYQWCNHFSRNNVGTFNMITINHSAVLTDVFTGTLFLDINTCVFTATGTCSTRSYQTQISFFKEKGSAICTVGSNVGTATAVNSPSGVTIGGPTFNFAPGSGSLGINMFAPTMTGGTLSHFNVSYSARVVFSSGDSVNSAIGGLISSISYIV